MSTFRAAGLSPNDTLETPRIESTPGSSCSIRRMPSIVSTAEKVNSGSPVARVKVSASKIRSSGCKTVLAGDDVVDRARDLQLALARFRHPDLVDGERDHRGAVRDDVRHDGVDPLAAVFHVDRVDDRAAGVLFQRQLDDVGLGRVDHERTFDLERQLFDELPHHLGLVRTLGQRDADVERVCALFHLIAGDRQHAVVVVGQRKALDLAAALRVEPLADDHRRRLLLELGRADHARNQRQRFFRARGDMVTGARFDLVNDLREVLGRGAAATADDPDVELLDHLAQCERHRFRFEWERRRDR